MDNEKEKLERTVRIVEGFDRLSEEKKIAYANSCFIDSLFASLRKNAREYTVLKDQDLAQQLVERFRHELDKYQKLVKKADFNNLEIKENKDAN